jgi:hypothetical protein
MLVSKHRLGGRRDRARLISMLPLNLFGPPVGGQPVVGLIRHELQP